MFSKGQQIFAVFFVIVFVAILIWSYRKDIKIHKKYYKWSWLVTLIVFILIIVVFAIVSYLLHD